MFQTEFEFTLPCGYLDAEGTLHREGVMRRATAANEILPLKDPRVVSNPSYLIVILLARVVTRLDGVEQVNTKVIEDLFTARPTRSRKATRCRKSPARCTATRPFGDQSG